MGQVLPAMALAELDQTCGSTEKIEHADHGQDAHQDDSKTVT